MGEKKKCLVEETARQLVSSGGGKSPLKVSDFPSQNQKFPSLFRSGNNYFFKITVNGERISVPTHADNLEDARRFQQNYFSRDKSEGPKKVVALLRLFSSAEENPKYLEASITGKNYTYRYARMEAVRAKHLLEIIPSSILDMPLKMLTRKEVEEVRSTIFRHYGTRPMSADVFKTFKACLNWAYQKGYMREMVAFRTEGIRVDKKEKDIPPFSFLLETAKNPLCFRTEVDMDRFFILMGTGLRRAELSAVQGKQLRRAMVGEELIYVLDISQSWKNENCSELGKPKWDIQRVIPLAKEVGERLWKYKKGDEDFLMKTSNSVWTDSFGYTKAMSKVDITPHKLRHALNTRLIESGVNPLLVQEYFGWHHQDRNRIQEGYTHIYVKALLEVSHAVEKVLAGKEGDGGLRWLD